MHACSVLGACQSIDQVNVPFGLSAWIGRENQQVGAVRIFCELFDLLFQASQGLSFFPMLHDEKINFALKFYPKLRKATIVIVESQLRFILGDNRSAEHVLIVTVPTDSQYSSHLTFAFGDGLQELIFLFERLPAN